MTKPRRNRGPREGTIYQRKDGRWCGEIFDPVTKRRRQFYGASYDEAHRKLTKAKTDRQEGVPLAGKLLRVRSFLLAWLKEHQARNDRGIRPRTVESYRYLIERHIAHECGEKCSESCQLAADSIGRLVLATLQDSDVERLLGRKLASGLSPRTVGYMLQLLRLALRYATKRGLIGRNVALLVDPVKGSRSRSRIEPLSLEQTKLLLAAVRGTRLDGFVTVAVHCGLRLGELLGLGWQDIDLDAASLAVRRTLQRNKREGWSCGEPKSEQGRRTVPLAAPVIVALRAHRARQLEERLRAGPEWQDWDLVFPALLGTPQHFKAALTSFQDALATAGLPRKRVHDLRHGCATMLLGSGTDLGVVAKQLGHSDAAFTLRTYVNPDDKQRRNAADRLAAMLAG